MPFIWAQLYAKITVLLAIRQQPSRSSCLLPNLHSINAMHLFKRILSLPVSIIFIVSNELSDSSTCFCKPPYAGFS